MHTGLKEENAYKIKAHINENFEIELSNIDSAVEELSKKLNLVNNKVYVQKNDMIYVNHSDMAIPAPIFMKMFGNGNIKLPSEAVIKPNGTIKVSETNGNGGITITPNGEMTTSTGVIVKPSEDGELPEINSNYKIGMIFWT